MLKCLLLKLKTKPEFKTERQLIVNSTLIRTKMNAHDFTLDLLKQSQPNRHNHLIHAEVVSGDTPTYQVLLT